jgi:AraC-like DNA-binding protein
MQKNGQETHAMEQPPCQRGSALAPWQARRVTRHVETHLEIPLRVADLANLVGLGPSQFSAAFRGSFGHAPHSYLVQRRVNRACELMETTREPLSQIAILCGFADQAHLTHVFRARVGVPPNAWRHPRDEAAASSRRISPPCLPDTAPRPQGDDQTVRGSRPPRSKDPPSAPQPVIGFRTPRPSDHVLPLM